MTDPQSPSPRAPREEGEAVRVGSRLRDSRTRQGLTIEEVAVSAGVTKGFISRLERDLVSPSVSTLVTLCQVLSLPVGELFAEPDLLLVRAGTAPHIQLTGKGAVESLLTARSQGRLQLVRSHIDRGGGGGDELYTLNAALEVLHVLSGRLSVRFATTAVEVGPGDTLSFSGREPHSWLNVGDGPAEVLWIIAPAPWEASA